MPDHPDYIQVFISHANPEENYFAAWLSSKLKIAGYDVWCDLKGLRGGHDFWKNIEKLIREKATVFLFVTSKLSIQKEGTLRELAIADRIRDRGDFIIPIRLDDLPYDQFPAELTRRIAIDFHDKWAKGLNDLLDDLKDKSVPKTGTFDTKDVLSHWHQGFSLKSDILVERNEPYLTNWFEIRPPQLVWIYDPKISSLNFLKTCNYSIYQEKKYLISFACPNCLKDYFDPAKNVTIDLYSYLSKTEGSVEVFGNSIKNFNQKVVSLLSHSMEMFLHKAGLKKYFLSGRHTVFYVPFEKRKTRVDLRKLFKTSIQLNGDFKGSSWHFGVEPGVFLRPTPAYFFTSHVIFTKEGSPIPKREQHTLRRKIGKDWYNKKWSDLLTGLITFLLGNEETEYVTVPACCSQNIQMNKSPIILDCAQGFNEPTSEELESSSDD
jgi:hypothetical protein